MKDLSTILIREDKSLVEALKLINCNGIGLLYVVDNDSILLGSLSDGDIRRFLISGGTLDSEVQECMNKSPMKIDFLGATDSKGTDWAKNKNTKHNVLPVVDVHGRLISIQSTVKDLPAASGIKYPIAKVQLNGKEVQNIVKATTSTWISSRGAFIQEAETQITSLTDSADTLVTANGTVALQLALAAHRIGPGDRVIVPNLTFAATANAVVACGAKPILVDIDPKTWTICTSQVEKVLEETNDVRAVIAVDLYGNPCDYTRLQSLSKRYGCYFIVDAAESIGAYYLDKHISTQYCDALTFSFFGNKTITCGEGGSVSFTCSSTAEYARILRDHGMNPKKKYWHDNIGFNFRMTNLQAAILVAQLEYLPSIVDAKKSIHETYKKLMCNSEKISFQQQNNQGISSFWLTSIILDTVNLEELSVHLRRNEIETRPVFYPLSEMPPYQCYKYPNVSYNSSQKVSNNGISLPSYTSLSESDQQFIASAIIDFINY